MWGGFKISALLSALSITAPATELAVDTGIKQVAIIGAGAAGSATAYYLKQFAEQDGLAINITVFEKTDRIGGRTLTVDAYGDPLLPVELGASIFVDVNYILSNASRDFELALTDAGGDGDGVLAIWDGDKFVYVQNDNSWGWWNLTKLFWKYGMAPYRAQKLVKATIATFLKLYHAPYFPFRSLTQRVYELDLAKITGVTGEQFLAENNIATLFSHDIIQAATRVNYASNLAYIHGLEAMVSMAPEGAVAVVGGNWQIFSNMIQSSNATIYQNASVASISLATPNDPDYPHSKFLVATKKADAEDGVTETHSVAFDNVVIATPWQFSDISAAEGLLEHAIDEIPYTRLHVTLFCSPFVLSPAFFNLEAGTRAPTTVLTTLADGEEPRPGASGAGKAGFYSISTLRTVTNPNTLRDEFLYKIFSPQVVTPEFLSDLLGVKVPGNFTLGGTEAAEGIESDMVSPISWYYPHVFNSYPIEYPRVTFQDPILRGGLYYTSGIESFISTMETSALMGMNVARLIANDFLGFLNKDNETTLVQEDGAQIALEKEQITPDEL